MTTKTIKFNDFMSGDYKTKDKARKNKIIKNTVSIASSELQFLCYLQVESVQLD
jgi:hypothetical protein